ncbi:hypothetical protein [Agitococcus lubricus]|uniref:Uncharacterized protein n=1 Tax=Agitococcus lubricus TaxID=1077255 RepID=A0A2T5IYT1_9GAMM|nr:hypothetical protein [Agitococcus lubricus]PTQ89175.1 hypothetical protein C8N29_10856 [Agitococcus lubricus]
MNLTVIFLLLGMVCSSTVCAGVLNDLRPCSKQGAFSFEQKIPYQPIALPAPVVGHCLAVPLHNKDKVCMQGSYPSERDDQADYFKLSYWQQGKSRLTWKSDGFLMAPAETFRLEWINVDGDTSPELVVSVLTSEGMGMGVQTSDIFIIDPQTLRVSPPITVEDYGRISGFYGKSGQACRLLAAQWQSHEDAKDSGLYAEGQWYQLKEGQWQVSSAWPKVSRRYLFRFQDQRAAATAPLLWFLDKTATILPE